MDRDAGYGILRRGFYCKEKYSTISCVVVTIDDDLPLTDILCPNALTCTIPTPAKGPVLPDSRFASVYIVATKSSAARAMPQWAALLAGIPRCKSSESVYCSLL